MATRKPRTAEGAPRRTPRTAVPALADSALVSADPALRALTSALVERYQFMRQAGITFGGSRDLYDVLGYDRIITAKQYRDRYARGGIAGRVVDALPNATWRGGAELVEDEDPEVSTPFESAWVELEKRLKIWAVLRRADLLAAMSTYAVVLIGAPGDLSSELPKGKPESLLYLTPFSGGGGPGSLSAGDADCTVRDLVTDAKSARFGLPLTYQLRRTDVASPDLQHPVHWTRIIHIAEGVLDDEIHGAPSLERVWNLLDDLDKVTGGGAEAFWLRANQGTQIDVNKDMELSTEAAAKLKDEIDEYRHNISRFMKTRGVKVNTLGSDVANFSGPADGILTQIAGAKAIPKRILTGSEMGELASSQDRDNWRDQVNGRRTSYAGPYIIEPLVDRLIEYGYLPAPAKYEIRWSSIKNLTEQEKADGAAKWATVNATQGTTVFTPEEIRDKWYEMEPLTDEEKEKAAPAQPVPEAEPAKDDKAEGDKAEGEEDAKTEPDDEEEAEPKAAQALTLDDEALVSELTLALLADDIATVGRICGISHGE